MVHEILIHARSVTSKDADVRYLVQSAACIDFCGAIRHGLDLDKPGTPERQLLVKEVTPSTTTTDRSDLVADSQRVKRVKLQYNHFTHAASMNDFPIQHPFNRLDMCPDEKLMSSNLHSSRNHLVEESLRFKMIESKQSNPHDSMLNDAQTQLLDYTSMSDYVPTAVNNNRKIAVTSCQPGRSALSTMAQHELNRSISADDLAKPINTSAFTAREAIAFREHQALLRRRANHYGLDRLDHISLKTDPQCIDSKNHADRDVMQTTADSRNPICVDLSLTIATDANHGQTRTPTPEERTTNESGRTERVSLEHDASPTSLLISPKSCRNKSRLTSMEKSWHSDHAVPQSTKKPRIEGQDSFILAQCAAPFYRPSFRLDTTNVHGSQAVKIGAMCSTNGHRIGKAPEHAVNHPYPANIPNFDQTKEVISDDQGNLCKQANPNKHSDTIIAHKELCQNIKSVQALTDKHEMLADVVNCIIESPLAHSTAVPGNARLDTELIHYDTGLAKGLAPILDTSFIKETPHIKRNIRASKSSSGPFMDKNIYDSCIPCEYRSGDKILLLLPPFNSDDPYKIPSRLLALRTPQRIKHQSRELVPEERGYWLVDLEQLRFPLQEARTFWTNLENMITFQKLLWVSLQYHKGTVRIYCFGSYAMKIWTLIYASSRGIKKGIPWMDYNSKEVLFN